MCDLDSNWPNASHDLEAVSEMERRLAGAATRRQPGPISYTRLVSDMAFQLAGKSGLHRINIHEWSGQDRGLVGEYLGYLSTRTYEQHGFMASALAVDSTERRPSESFYDLAQELGAFQNHDDREVFWIGQLNASIAHYNKHEPAVGHDTLPSESEFLDFTRQIIEGTAHQQNLTVRKRCSRLLEKAKAHYRNGDGLLHCSICGWSKPSEKIAGDIVELHHNNPLADAPKKGRLMSLMQATSSLTPLCPNCHRMTHAKIEGGFFAADELKKLIR